MENWLMINRIYIGANIMICHLHLGGNHKQITMISPIYLFFKISPVLGEIVERDLKGGKFAVFHNKKPLNCRLADHFHNHYQITIVYYDKIYLKNLGIVVNLETKKD
jgi:hypothetical protein